jgi:hypothetical protein
VRVAGEIIAYRGTPEIVVHDPSQIIVEDAPQRPPEQATPINPPSGTAAKGPEAKSSTDAGFDPSTVRMDGTMPPDHFVEAAVYTDAKGIRAIYRGGDPKLLTAWKELK